MDTLLISYTTVDFRSKTEMELALRRWDENKEKWLTLYDAYKKIDDLREKCDNENDYISMQSLNEINKYLETIEYKLQEN